MASRTSSGVKDVLNEFQDVNICASILEGSESVSSSQDPPSFNNHFVFSSCLELSVLYKSSMGRKRTTELYSYARIIPWLGFRILFLSFGSQRSRIEDRGRTLKSPFAELDPINYTSTEPGTDLQEGCNKIAG